MSIFRFFSSLNLALILLSVLIVGLATGTVVESQHSTAFAKARIYDAPWFSLWLAFLIINLTCAALIRFPWKPHLTGFVITHAGIIIMLVGSKVGQMAGVEGGMDLHTQAAPVHRLEKFDDQWIEVGLPAVGRIHRLPYSVAVDAPRPNNPKVYQVDADQLIVRVLDVQPVDPVDVAVPVAAVDAASDPRHSPNAGTAALRFAFSSQRMNQRIEEWLYLGSRITPGPIEFRFLRGRPPAVVKPADTAPGAPAAKVPSMERFFFFQAAGLGMMKSKPQIGPDSGLSGRLVFTAGDESSDNQYTLHLSLGGKAFELPVTGREGQELPLDGTAYRVLVEKLFLNLHVTAEGAADREGPAKNPAAVVKLLGPPVDPTATPAPTTPDPHASMGGGKTPQRNQLFFYLTPEGDLQYWAHSPTHGDQAGPLAVHTPLALGWADMQVEVNRFYPRAQQRLYFKPLPGIAFDPAKSEGLRPGVLCEVTYNGDTQQVWLGRQRRNVIEPQTLLMNGKTVNLQLGNQTVDLGFEVGLKKFEVPTDEGTMNPADFKSTLEIGPAARPGQPAQKETSQIYMNNPTNYPNNLLGAYLGTSYKFSQANHDPRDPGFSGVQVLQDPGWMPKWVGALMICFGIFTMFYLKPYFHRPRTDGDATPPTPEQTQASRQAAADILRRAKSAAATGSVPATNSDSSSSST